jgi:hypothetical protein
LGVCVHIQSAAESVAKIELLQAKIALLEAQKEIAAVKAAAAAAAGGSGYGAAAAAAFTSIASTVAEGINPAKRPRAE